MTTCGVVVAGLGGAGVTAYVNRRNVRDAHKAERELWELGRSHEQMEALQAKKEELYVRFLVTLDEYMSTLGQSHFQIPRRLDPTKIYRLRQDLQNMLKTVTLFRDTAFVEKTMMDTLSATTRFLGVIEDSINEDREVDGAAFDKANEEVITQQVLMIVAMRLSLGHFISGKE